MVEAGLLRLHVHELREADAAGGHRGHQAPRHRHALQGLAAGHLTVLVDQGLVPPPRADDAGLVERGIALEDAGAGLGVLLQGRLP
jgi:hypothetical protein